MAWINNIRSLAFTIAIAVTILVFGHCARAEISRAEFCFGDAAKLTIYCHDFLVKFLPKQDPTPQCCEVIMKANVPCICNHIPKVIKAIVSMEKLANVAEFCGNPLEPGSTCGGTFFDP